MIKNVLLRIFVSLPLLVTAINAQDGVDAIEKARQAKEAADKAAAEAAAATEAAIEAAATKAAKEARENAKKKKEEEEARKIAEAQAAEEAELDAAASAAAEEAKRRMAAELGLEITDGEETTEADGGAQTDGDEVVDDVVAKESSGFNIGVTGSVGFINGEYISNTPVGGSVVITTPWGFKLGALDLGISFAFGSYSGEASGGAEVFNPTAMGIGANATLGKIVFSETHIGIVGAGTGLRSFAGVTLERFLKGGLNLPFNILIGGEGFISTEPNEGNEEASYWGGLGVRLDYSL